MLSLSLYISFYNTTNKCPTLLKINTLTGILNIYTPYRTESLKFFFNQGN